MNKSVLLSAFFLLGLPLAAADANDYRAKAEQGDAVAMREMGRCYEEGNGVSKLPQEAKFWYTKAAKAGDAEASYRLAMLDLASTEDGNVVSPMVLSNLRTADKAGYAPASDALGCLYMAGKGVKMDKKKAMALFRKGAEGGCADSQFRIGMCYMQGTETEKDVAEAAKWFRKAAEQGHNESSALLGSILLAGEGVEKNEEEGLKYLRLAADGGSVMAQRNLGIAKLRALGMEENADEAVVYLRRAAGMGDAMAMYYLGACYAEGKGVEQNLRLAGVLFNNALAKGIAKAADALNQLPAEHRERISNPLELVRADAEWGSATAQYQLSRYYQLRLDGDPLEDAMDADFWLRRAAENGHPAAKALLEKKEAEKAKQQ